MRRSSSLKQTKFWRKVRDADAGNTTRLTHSHARRALCVSRLKFGASSTR